MNKKTAEKIIIEFDKIVDKGFLCYGSALGAWRENGVIEHDLDVDFGIMSDDFSWSIVNKLIGKGFALHSVFGSRYVGLELSFNKEGIKIDLMIFYKHGNRLWNCLWQNGGRFGLNDMITHSYKPFDITMAIVNGYSVKCAGLDYIKQVYGDAWQIPMKTWNWRTDHHCIDDNLRNELRQNYG